MRGDLHLCFIDLPILPVYSCIETMSKKSFKISLVHFFRAYS